MDLSFTYEVPVQGQSEDTHDLFTRYVGGAISEEMQSVLGDIAGATPYGYASEWDLQDISEGGDTVGVGITNGWDKWWVREYDMPAHEITAREGPYLTFEWDGHLVQVASVHHPGSRGNHAVENAMKSHQSALEAAVQSGMYAMVVSALSGGGR